MPGPQPPGSPGISRTIQAVIADLNSVTAFQDVAYTITVSNPILVGNPSAYGTEVNQHNHTTFDAGTTTTLHATMQTPADAVGVGALQWKVYAVADEPDPATGP